MFPLNAQVVCFAGESPYLARVISQAPLRISFMNYGWCGEVYFEPMQLDVEPHQLTLTGFIYEH